MAEEISKNLSLYENLYVIIIEDDDIQFHKVFGGCWFHFINKLPSISIDVINNLITLTSILENEYGIIAGSYESLMKECGYLLSA